MLRPGGHLVLTEEGLRALNAGMSDLVAETGARAILLVGSGGQLISAQGETQHLDTMSLAALGSGSFGSNRAIAGLVGEEGFRRMFQQGRQASLYMSLVGSGDLLLVVFPNEITMGKIKFQVDQALPDLEQALGAMYKASPTTPFRAAPQAAPKIQDLF
ncbi:MAG: roadblock/LC7 domain-containing protein [Candidatus Sericytochromatia bacterium]|nr:roadblock/LC7 domain-containing protein [Candidatus Sericytochromatia bacterium]